MQKGSTISTCTTQLSRCIRTTRPVDVGIRTVQNISNWYTCPDLARREHPSKITIYIFPFFSFSFISLIADGPCHYHPACGHKGSSHLSPGSRLTIFCRDASSALLQLVNQWLNFTYSRSHAFRYERKNTDPTLVRIDLTTSALAGVQVNY